MKLNRLLIFVSIFFILILSVGFISANDASNQTDDDCQVDILMAGNAGNTIVVEPDKENPNQMVKPTVQPAIDEANPGDTIVLKGNFAHGHFMVNKTLDFVADSSTTINPCPHYQTEGAGDYGVFYVTGNASGSSFDGITFINNARAQSPFSFLIRNVSDICISNCIVNYKETDEFKFQGIIIENSNNVRLSNLIINNTINGIRIVNSSKVEIADCIISNSLNQAISISGNSANVVIKRNQIQNNGLKGIKLTSANNIIVLNNYLVDNGLNDADTGSAIYVNTNITKLTVKGNIFMHNGLHGIMYDYRCRNLNNEEGADLLTDIDNNYFEAHSSMVLHHRVYVERDHGEYKYDAENDVYGSVGEGNYAEGKSYVYMKNAFIFNDVPCGFTYYTTKIPWTLQAPANGGKYDFSLRINLKQVKSGLYQVSIVDSKGNVAKDFDSVGIMVFLNDYFTVNPRNGDIFKRVLLKNGVGQADFRSVYSSFNSTGNVITAVFPGTSERVEYNAYVQLNVRDADIPINPATKLISSKLTTYPLSDKYLSVKLVDSKGNAIPSQKVTFKFNGKTYSAKTDGRGIAKVKVSLSSKKNYPVTITYSGSDDYRSSKTSAKIIVKTGSKKSKITSKNMKVKRNKKKAFSLKLTNGAGKALKSQKVIVKINGKTHTIKTNSKGIAKLSIKLPNVRKYKIIMKFLGNGDYKASSKTGTITVYK